jgi:hypothetical protein
MIAYQWTTNGAAIGFGFFTVHIKQFLDLRLIDRNKYEGALLPVKRK